MPQTLNEQWKTMLGVKNASKVKQCLHTLGNLTLTGYNPELSNKTFDEKKLIYQESNVSLNKYFQDVDTWKAEAIQKRTSLLCTIHP